MAGSSIHITPEMREEAKRLLKLMGVPYIDAPCEAEAQCAKLVTMEIAFATATEDMDALTFGSKFLLRGINGKKEPVTQVDLYEVWKGFDMT